ncbi:MAG: hypothetical protein JXA79_12405 [Deltaproteobacteria bacterium]|nr:hypothetical protein [Deltaproteobacteria bacterium]
MEQLFTWEQTAKECGISVKELIAFAKKDGLIDENGKPTQRAIDEGLLAELPFSES